MKCIACLDKVQLPKCQGSHIRWEYPWGISGSNYNSRFLPSNLQIYWPLLFMRFHLFSLHLAHDSSFKGNPVPSDNFVPLPKAPPTTPQVQSSICSTICLHFHFHSLKSQGNVERYQKTLTLFGFLGWWSRNRPSQIQSDSSSMTLLI